MSFDERQRLEIVRIAIAVHSALNASAPKPAGREASRYNPVSTLLVVALVAAAALILGGLNHAALGVADERAKNTDALLKAAQEQVAQAEQALIETRMAVSQAETDLHRTNGRVARIEENEQATSALAASNDASIRQIGLQVEDARSEQRAVAKLAELVSVLRPSVVVKEGPVRFAAGSILMGFSMENVGRSHVEVAEPTVDVTQDGKDKRVTYTIVQPATELGMIPRQATLVGAVGIKIDDPNVTRAVVKLGFRVRTDAVVQGLFEKTLARAQPAFEAARDDNPLATFIAGLSQLEFGVRFEFCRRYGVWQSCAYGFPVPAAAN